MAGGPGWHAEVVDLLKGCTHELREIDVGNSIQRVHISDLSALRFAQQFVGKNKPVIIEGALDGWPALRLWNAAYLSDKAGAAHVTVDLTPNGRGDAVQQVAFGGDGSHRCEERCEESSSSSQRPPKCIDLGWGAQGEGCAPPTHSSSSSSSSSTSIRGTGSQGQEQQGQEQQGQQQQQSPPLPLPGEKWFITPCERQLRVRDFFRLLIDSRRQPGLVPYVQHQNSSLTEEWAFLSDDTRPGLPWADEVFGGPPDATNLWIGDERSVTSFHKDHYENLYGVVRGTKTFHLLPPSDSYRLYSKRYPTAQWCCTEPPPPPTGSSHPSRGGGAGVQGQGDGRSAAAGGVGSVAAELGISLLWPRLQQPPAETSWTEVDPEPDDPAQAAAQHPLFHSGDLPKPLVARVGPGDLLYLPALWYHRVSQARHAGEECVVAVNMWYDMAYGPTWAHLKLVEGLAAKLGLSSSL